MSTTGSPLYVGPRPGLGRQEPTEVDARQLLGRILQVLSRRRWLFILPALTTMIVILGVSLFLPREYSVSTLFERRDDAVVTTLIMSNSPYSFTTLRKSLEDDLRGYNVLSNAVDQVGLTRDLDRDEAGELTAAGRVQRQMLLEKLAGQITVRVKEQSDTLDTIQLFYMGDDPETGKKLLTQLRENYFTLMRGKIRDLLERSRDFFRDEARERQEAVAKLVWSQIQFSSQHPGVRPDDHDALDGQYLAGKVALENLARDRGQALSQITARKELIDRIDGLPGAEIQQPPPPPEQIPNPMRNAITDTIEQLRKQIVEAKALRGMTDQHPHIQDLQRRIELRAAELESLPELVAAPPTQTAGAVPPLRPYEADRERVLMEIRTLEQVVTSIDADIEAQQVQLTQIEQEMTMLLERREQYMTREQALQNARTDLQVWNGHAEVLDRVLVAATADRGIQFTTIEEARGGSRPRSPTLSGVYMLTVGLGLSLGAVLVFLAEVFDHSIRHPARVRQLVGLAVLGTIEELRRPSAAARWTRRSLLVGVTSVQVALIAGLGVLVYVSLLMPTTYDRIAPRLSGLAPW